MAKGSRARKKKDPFWKKLDPELQHIGKHIGKIVDNTSLKDVADIAVLLGCSYYGYKTMGNHGLIVGAVGYKLATTRGGAPPVSQIAGLGVLGAIGLVGALKSEYAAFSEGIAPSASKIADEIKEAEAKGEEYVPPSGICEWDRFGQLRCWFPSLGWVYFNKYKPSP